MKKFFLKSKSVQGVLIAAFAFFVKWASYKGWMNYETAKFIEANLSGVLDLLGFGGLGYALYGRTVTNGEKLTLRTK